MFIRSEIFDELIFDLIFGSQTEYLIDISIYVDDIYSYDDFVDSVRIILKKSKVVVIKSNIRVDSKTATWELKVRK